MSILVVFIGEIPVRVGRDTMFVNSWCFENVFGAGDDGIAYLDASKQVRINPSMLLQDPEAVAVRAAALGGGRWTLDQVRSALTSPLQHLLAHFEVERGALGTIVRVSKAQRARLHGDPNVNCKVRIPDTGIHDVAAQNGDAAGDEARGISERAAMAEIANIVSRIRA